MSLSCEIPLIIYIERRSETTILLSFDPEKAFDRVNRSFFLLDLLVAVGFGPDFCRWIATLYNGAYMPIILLIGLLSEFPRVILREYALIKDFVLRTLWDKSN